MLLRVDFSNGATSGQNLELHFATYNDQEAEQQQKAAQIATCPVVNMLTLNK
jgi:hypothetical protein